MVERRAQGWMRVGAWIALPFAAAVASESCASPTNSTPQTTTTTPTCTAEQATCNGACTNVASDGANCGACGNACAAGQVCSQGKCALSCGGGTTQCGTSCVALKTDDANCGACNVKCSSGQSCSNGVCRLSCAAPQVLCTASSDGGLEAGSDGGNGADGGAATYCANTQSDNANCGGCGVSCGATKACSGGTCCSSGLQGCGGMCIDVLSDVNNCGACGNVCPAQAAYCSAGACVSNPTHFNILSKAPVTYQGFKYIAVEVSLASPTSGGATWCDDYENLCKVVIGGSPVGCGQPYNPGAAGYQECGTLYGSNGVNDTLGCNPSSGVAAASVAAGFMDATGSNSFGFHYCGAQGANCKNTWCTGQYCNSALSYMDSSQAHGYTLCLQ